MAKKRLMPEMKCDKCGNPPKRTQQGAHTVIELNCECGGRIQHDFTRLYYEDVPKEGE